MSSLFREKKAVSEVMGTVLLLGLAVAIFSSLYVIVLSEPFDSSEPYPTIVAFVEGNYIVIEHRGGDELDVGSKFRFDFGGRIIYIPIDDKADVNLDGRWGIGERLLIELTDIHGGDYPYDPDNLDVDILGPQTIENGETPVFSGSLDIHPKSDIGIKCTVSDESPVIGQEIVITITVTHYTGDMVIPAGLNIYFLLPDGLLHINNNTNSGEYNDKTGDWVLDELGVRGSATLTITAKVVAKGTLAEYTQLALLLDGSGSISPSDWMIMREGMALAVINGYIPRNEMVELTVIQFGGSSSTTGRTWAQVELGGPIILNETNYNAVANQILGMTQLGGGTAMSSAFRLAADVMSGDPYGHLIGTDEEGMGSPNSDWPRQVVNLVTDGKPNGIYDHSNRYTSTWAGLIQGRDYEYVHGKADTEATLDYFLSLVLMNKEEGDEIDAVAVGTNNDIPWLRDYIVRPQPGYDTWPPEGPGWVRHVSSYTEFANTLDEQFEFIFSGMKIKADMKQSSPIDITIKVNIDKNILPEN